ncbi:salicylate hydroxylase, partial [Flagelloscypha sp. PMI_526]
MSPRFRVAISGAGISGLAIAAYICQNSEDIEVDLYETKPVISTIGAGIAVWKRTWDVLVELGFQAECEKRNLRIPKEGEARGFDFRKADEPEGYDFHSPPMPYGPLTVPRPMFLEMLQAQLTDKCRILTSKNIVTYEVDESGSVLITFTDGTTSTADILVGADGVHSNIRASMYNKLSQDAQDNGEATRLKALGQPIFSGSLCYRATAPFEKVKANHPNHKVTRGRTIWCGKNKHIVTSNAIGRSVIDFVFFYNIPNGEGTTFEGLWVEDVPPQEVHERYQEFEPGLLSLFKYFETVNRWAIHVVSPLPRFVADKVALVGDAAHAMLPHQGVGGGQSTEDAYILGKLLSHKKTNRSNLAQVLEIYQTIRMPLAQEAYRKSHMNGRYYEFTHPDFDIGPGHPKSSLEKWRKLSKIHFHGWQQVDHTTIGQKLKPYFTNC